MKHSERLSPLMWTAGVGPWPIASLPFYKSQNLAAQPNGLRICRLQCHCAGL